MSMEKEPGPWLSDDEKMPLTAGDSNSPKPQVSQSGALTKDILKAGSPSITRRLGPTPHVMRRWHEWSPPFLSNQSESIFGRYFEDMLGTDGSDPNTPVKSSTESIYSDARSMDAPSMLSSTDEPNYNPVAEALAREASPTSFTTSSGSAKTTEYGSLYHSRDLSSSVRAVTRKRLPEDHLLFSETTVAVPKWEPSTSAYKPSRSTPDQDIDEKRE